LQSPRSHTTGEAPPRFATTFDSSFSVEAHPEQITRDDGTVVRDPARPIDPTGSSEFNHLDCRSNWKARADSQKASSSACFSPPAPAIAHLLDGTIRQ
jgi:hypothetical protein